MQRFVTISAVFCTALFIYGGWIGTSHPKDIDAVNEYLDREVMAYEVINGTPIIIAEYGGTFFLDTLERQPLTKAFPPTPGWKWTGDWERIHRPDSPATADITSKGGSSVIYGLVNDDSITGIHVVRDGVIIHQISVSGPGYIIEVIDVKNTDTIVFVNTNGEEIAKTPLTPTVGISSGDQRPDAEGENLCVRVPFSPSFR